MSLREESTSPLAPLVFLHIPKTAGQSLIESLKEHFPASDSLALYVPLLPVDGFEYKQNVLSSPSLIVGHFSYGLPNRILGNLSYRYITFLRHPYARVISQYMFDRDYYFDSSLEYDQSFKEEIFSLSPICFIEKIKIWTYDNCLTRMISGVGGSLPVGYIDLSILEIAKGNLENFFFVGFQESYQDSLQELELKLGIKITENSKNRIQVERIKEILTKDEISQISKPSDRNKYDLELYNWAIKNYFIKNKGNE